jgi:hypothetical protein
MKVCRHKITKRLLETQFGEDTDVLIRNNSQYFSTQELEVVNMMPVEYEEILRLQNENDLSKEQKIEFKIRVEMNRILREQAIVSLKAKGEI